MLEVVDNHERSQYEILVDGDVVGFAAYNQHADGVLLPHVEVRPELNGQGIGSKLVTGRARRHPPAGFARGAALPVRR